MNSLTQLLVNFLYKDTTTLRLSLGFSAIALALGFVFGNSAGNSYCYLAEFMPFAYWAGIFGIYGSLLVIASFNQVYRWLLCTLDAIGLWLWIYLFLSFAVIDPTPNTSAEYMLVIPIFSSLWLISDRLFKTYIYKQVFQFQ